MTPLERLQGGYYNSEPVSLANPGGLAGDGHVVNFPAVLLDIAAVAAGIVLDAEAIGQAGEHAEAAALSATAAGEARDEAAEIAAGRTVRWGMGAPASGLGRNGDWYIDATPDAPLLYGPKTAGAWGAGAAMLGTDAEEVELRMSADLIQWRRGAGEWATLFSVSGLASGVTQVAGLDGSVSAAALLSALDLQIEDIAGLPAALSALSSAIGSMGKASGADIRTATDDAKFLTAKSVADAMAYVPLTDASTVAIDLASGTNFTLLTTSAVGTNRTFGAPTNGKPGQTFTVEITTDAANRTAAYNSAFKFPGASVPAITTTSGRRDRLVCQVNAAGGIDAQLIKDLR